MISIIDTHAYIGSEPNLGIDINPEFYRDLKKEFSNYDLKFIVMPPSKKDCYRLPSIVKENRDIFVGGILQFNPNQNLEQSLGYLSTKELEKIIEQGDIVGLKMHTSFTQTRVDDSSVGDFADLAINYGLPMVFHCASTGQDFTHPDYFRILRDKKPALKIVCAHYGGLEEGYIREYIKLINELPELYLNTAGLSGEVKRRDVRNDPSKPITSNNPDKFVELFLETVPAIQDSVLFGTDAGELDFSLHPVDKTNFSIQRKLFYSNPKKVFRINY